MAERRAAEKHSISHTFTKRYVCVEEVPPLYRERYILTGYRQPYSSISDCIISIFRLNNETVNIWSHLVPLVFLLHYFYRTFPSEVWPPQSIPTCYYPLLLEEISICGYLLGSTLAHIFNCMTPRIRHICFYIDYIAISLFAMGGSCTNYYYLRPLGTGLPLEPNIFLAGASACNVFMTYCLCASRHRWDGAKYVIRTLSASVTLVYGNSLTFLRFVMCLLGSGEYSYSMPYMFLCWFTYLISGMFNATRLPEKLYPGVFDILGHNHQFLHVITTLGTLCHIWAIQVDLEARKDTMPVLLDGLTMYSSVGWPLFTLFLCSAVAVWFGSHLTTNGDFKTQEREKKA